jgi:ABC-type nitrate/sulfonate/bicarbonate transport system substrate-binding protein
MNLADAISGCITKHMRLPRGLCLVTAALVALPGAASGQELRKISIAVSSASIPASTARIANELGLFKKHGLDPTIRVMDSGSNAMAALVSRSVDFITHGAGDLILAHGRGQKPVAIAPAYRGSGAVLVISKVAAERAGVSSSGPISERLKALDGLTIASPSATSPYSISIRSSAESVGAKINLVYMSQPAMAAALQRGAIQGFTASSPFWVQPSRSDFGVAWISGPKGEFPPKFAPANSTWLSTMRDFAEANPDLVKRAVAAFIDFGKAVVERPAVVKAALVRLYPDLDAATLDVLFDTESRGFAIGPMTIEEINHDIEFMKFSGLNLPGIDSVKPADIMFP